MMLTKFVDPLPLVETIQPVCLINNIPYYELSMKENSQKLHRDLPPAKIWGFNGHYPGPTFHVWRNQPVYVLWKNELPLKHFFPIDTTVHGASKNVPQVRTVVHLHGGVTPEGSDGYPEAWFTRGFEKIGIHFKHKVYFYPNQQPATTLWYHDHAIGITRLNNYAGLTGFYIIHDQNEKNLHLPSEPYDIPLLIQDRSINEDGSLYYPSQTTPPNETVNPSVVRVFFGDFILVNGKVWPFLEVEPRKYRFRILNGSNSRFFRLTLNNGDSFIQTGTDQGLLPTPIKVYSLLLAPAERADVIIDFTDQLNQTIIINNDAETPFPNGDKPNLETTCTVMQFRVNKPLLMKDQSQVPLQLALESIIKEEPQYKQRNLLLNMQTDPYKRPIHLLNNQKWSDPLTEIPKLGSTEVWNLINITEQSHPIHLHLVRFQLLDRQPFDVNIYKEKGKIVTTGAKRKADLNEQGRKDTVRANPGEITRIIVPFGPYTGLFVWHCHILEHEDYEMMRPYYVIS
ncbi:multicopper oxidase [Bacillus carboniphilus]|uniref:Multicopper oxidase n=1 Tax=Bacillus carboniphilus TaxID=86663 RepID=A0ABY9JXW0_9BACI|nr:multicopper oxidase [Bacillus carboniphilus]WLR44216.1 multicopper oxidase [Bacillus carboniphilus]